MYPTSTPISILLSSSVVKCSKLSINDSEPSSYSAYNSNRSEKYISSALSVTTSHTKPFTILMFDSLMILFVLGFVELMICEPNTKNRHTQARCLIFLLLRTISPDLVGARNGRTLRTPYRWPRMRRTLSPPKSTPCLSTRNSKISSPPA